MRPHTDRVPKAMLPVLGRPFIDWQLDLLASQGVDEVVVSVGHLGQTLMEHLTGMASDRPHTQVVDEGSALRGTGGAVRLAIDSGALAGPFLLLNGDSYLPIRLADVVDAWRRSGMPALMTVFRNEDRFDLSNAVVADGRVVLYDKSRPPEWAERMLWIDYGLAILTPDVVVDRIPSGAVADIADTMRDLSRGNLLAAHEVGTRFYEIGSPGGLTDLERHLAGRQIQPAV